MRTILAIVGLPGAGKTTAAEATSALMNVPVLSTGAALRELSLHNTELAAELGRGMLGPEILVERIVNEFLQSTAIAILDGYPRHLKQAKHLLTRRARLVVAHLVVAPSLAIARIRQRPARGDDSDASIMERLTREEPALEEVAQALSQHVTRVDATTPPRAIADQLVALCA